MANWAYIENNEIKEYHEILPENWKNMSNFHVLKDNLDHLKTLNWLPIVKVIYSYDPVKQKLDNKRYVVDGSIVKEVYDIIDIPEITKPKIDDVIKMLSNCVQSRLDNFAQTRNYDNILSACTYINDIKESIEYDYFEGECCVCQQFCNELSGWKCETCDNIYCDEHNCEKFTCNCE